MKQTNHPCTSHAAINTVGRKNEMSLNVGAQSVLEVYFPQSHQASEHISQTSSRHVQAVWPPVTILAAGGLHKDWKSEFCNREAQLTKRDGFAELS